MVPEKINVLFLASWYPKRVSPSNGSFIQKHAEAAAASEHVHVLHVASDENLEKKYELVSDIINGVSTTIVYFPKSKNPVSRLRRYFTAHIMGYRYVLEKMGRIDIVHLNVLFPAGLFALFLKAKGIPYLATEHWTGYGRIGREIKLNLIKRKAFRMISSSASMITVSNQSLKEDMLRNGINGKYGILYNAIDIHRFKPAEIRSLKKKFRFLHVSSLRDDQKNISGMLRSIKALSRIRSDFEVLIAGKGKADPFIEYSEREELDGFVRFEGQRTSTEVAALMKDSDCFMLFSEFENLPNVMLEAMSCGLPTIATAVGGISEHLSPERGIIVPAGDEPALAHAMSTMIDTSGSYNPVAIRQYAADHFSYEKVGKRLGQLYKSILQAGL